MGLILFIVALVLMFVIYPIGYAFMWIKFIFTLKFKELDNLHLKIAIEIDELGNLMFKDLFNKILIKPGGYPFGNDEQTISHVIGVNKLTNNLTKLGKFIADILNKIEKNHVEKAAEK